MSEGPGGGLRFLAPAPRGDLQPPGQPPSFSFVIPAYEAAATIGAALESAFAQTLPAYEVIVVDDGSGDDLDGALAPFADRVVLIRKANGGVASARNVGVEAASGDFYVVLDADDRCDPRRLEALAALLKARPDLDLATTDIRLTVAGEQIGLFRDWTPFAVEDQRTAILWSCFLGGWPAVRLARLREVGGFDQGLRTGEDWDCWLRLIFSGSSAGLVTAPYYDYAVDSGGLTAARVASLWDRVTLLEKAAAGIEMGTERRRELAGALRYHRGRAALTEARASAAHGGRRRPAQLALSRGIDMRTRLRCGVAAALPQLASDPGKEGRR